MNKKQIIVHPSNTISDTIELMNDVYNKGGSPGIAVVVDEDYYLKGVVTDGDIRRAVGENSNLNEPITKIMTTDPISFQLNNISPNSISNIFSIMSKKDRFTSKIIIIDKNNKFYDIINLNKYLHTNVYRSKEVIIYGMGFVGLTLGIVLSETNSFNVTGFDINTKIINDLNNKIPPFFEKGIKESLSHLIDNERIKFSDKINDSYDIHIITVGTPIGDNNKPNLESIKKCIEYLAKDLKRGDLIICRSTVPVGTTREYILPFIEKKSNLIGGIDFHLAFAPERTIEGNGLEELKTLPQIIAGLTPACVQLACNLFEKFSSSIIRLNSFEEAEMIKLINNSFRDLVFAFSNEVAFNCEKYNIDAFNLIRSANEGYPRNKIPEPSPGVGGSCLTKDPFLYTSNTKRTGFTSSPKQKLSNLSRNINSLGVDYALYQYSKFLKSHSSKDTIIPLVIGLAFKGWPETNDTRFSVGKDLAMALKDMGYSVRVRDYVVSKEDITKIGFLDYDPENDSVNAIFIMNNHPSNYKFELEKILKKSKDSIFIFDGFGLLNKNQILAYESIRYSTLGYYDNGNINNES